VTNQFTFEGRIVALETPSTVLKVWIEQEIYYRDESHPHRVPVTFFSNKAEALKGRLSVGQQVIASGTIKGRQWQDKFFFDLHGTECLVVKGEAVTKAAPEPEPEIEDDLPFSSLPLEIEG